MSRASKASDPLPETARFLRLLGGSASLTDLEQWLVSASHLSVFIQDTQCSELLQLVASTDMFALLCSSLAHGLQLLAAPSAAAYAAAAASDNEPPAAAAAASERSLITNAAVTSAIHSLLVHVNDDQSSAHRSYSERVLASIDASGGLLAAPLRRSLTACTASRRGTCHLHCS